MGFLAFGADAWWKVFSFVFISQSFCSWTSFCSSHSREFLTSTDSRLSIHHTLSAGYCAPPLDEKKDFGIFCVASEEW